MRMQMRLCGALFCHKHGNFFDSSLPILFWVKGGYTVVSGREIVGRGFALFGAAQFNLVCEYRAQGRSGCPRFLQGCAVLPARRLQMLYHFLLHFGGKVSRYEMPG